MITAYIESRGDNPEDTWAMENDLPFVEYESFYEGLAALWRVAADDLSADWHPQRRLVVHNSLTKRTNYYAASYRQAPL